MTRDEIIRMAREADQHASANHVQWIGPEPLIGKTWRDYLPDLAGWGLAVFAVLLCYTILVWASL